MKKPFYRSKTIWGSIALGLIGIGQIAYTGEIDANALVTLAGSLGLYGLRDAMD